MGVREALDKHKTMTTSVVIGIIVLALISVALQLRDRGSAGNVQEQAFFTIDDGKSWFADDIHKIPPFDHDGKPAYRCYVYTNDGGKTKFVSHLERFPPEAKKKLEVSNDTGEVDLRAMSQLEVKLPGAADSGWIRQSDPRAAAIVVPKAPSGKAGNIELVRP